MSNCTHERYHWVLGERQHGEASGRKWQWRQRRVGCSTDCCETSQCSASDYPLHSIWQLILHPTGRPVRTLLFIRYNSTSSLLPTTKATTTLSQAIEAAIESSRDTVSCALDTGTQWSLLRHQSTDCLTQHSACISGWCSAAQYSTSTRRRG